MAEPEASVVVAARDAEESIGTLLDALARQTLPSDRFEVIVVVDGSRDRTAEVARAAPGVRVIEAPGRVGLMAARNLGIREARAPILAFTDADCVPAPDWLERGMGRLASEPELTLLGCRVTIPLGERPDIAELLDAARHFDQEAYVRDGFVAGGAMLARREEVVAAGLLNERLAHYGHEDVELCGVILDRGGRIAYEPTATLSHPPREGLRQLARKSYRLGRGLAPLRRHARGGSPPRTALLRPWHLLPNPRLRRAERLRERGIELSALRRTRLLLAQYLFCDLPYFAGDAVGTVVQLLRDRQRR